MKSFVCIALLACAFVAVAAKPLENQAEAAVAAEESPLGSSAAVDASRIRKAAYGASAGYQAHVPSPPCPNNYLFSCSPNLSPVPCAASGYGQQAAYSGYGQQGAYSAPVPSFAAPYGFMPQNLDAQYYQY